jgi:hypothetical protein
LGLRTVPPAVPLPSRYSLDVPARTGIWQPGAPPMKAFTQSMMLAEYLHGMQAATTAERLEAAIRSKGGRAVWFRDGADPPCPRPWASRGSAVRHRSDSAVFAPPATTLRAGLTSRSAPNCLSI